MYAELKGKIALVTGSGRPGGLGLSIAARLARDGALVMLHDVGNQGAGVGTSEDLDLARQSILEAGGTAEVCTGDLTKEEDVRQLVERTVSVFGGLDILVNNAGVGFKFSPLMEMATEDFDLVQSVNLRGAYLASRYAAAQMLKQTAQQGWGRGRIISIGSRAAKSGSAWAGAYSISKHALTGLTRSLALELAPHEITVNSVNPNHVTTQLGSWQNEYMAKMRGQSVEQYLADMRGRIPMGRVGQPEDTANACAFLASSQAAYITAEAMNVSGGEEYH